MKLWNTAKNNDAGFTFGWALALHGLGLALFWCGCFLLWENWFYGGDVSHWASRVAEIASFCAIGLVATRVLLSEKKMALAAMAFQLGAFGLQSVGLAAPFGAVACGMCAGAATALFLCAAMIVFSRFRPRATQVCIIGAFIVSHGIAVAATWVAPDALAQVDSLALMVGSLLLFFTCLSCPELSVRESFTREERDLSKSEAGAGVPPIGEGAAQRTGETDSSHNRLRAVWFLMRPIVVPAMVFALLCGVATQLFVEGAASSSGLYVMADIAAVVALAILLGIAFFDIDLTVETSTLVVLPVFAGIMLAASLLSPDGIVDIGVCIRTSFTVVQVLVWVYFAREGYESGSISLAAFALSFGLLRGSVLIGRLLGTATSFLGASSLSNLLFALIALWLLYVTVMLFRGMMALRRSSSAASDRAVKETDSEGTSLSVPAACHAIANRYGLSSREERIMELFASGRTASYIGKELFVSESTVRTYIRRIYQKMDSHSRQDLMDEIEIELNRSSCFESDYAS